MSHEENLKKHKDAFVSAVFSLNKAAQEAQATVVELLQAIGDLGVIDSDSLARALASAGPQVPGLHGSAFGPSSVAVAGYAPDGEAPKRKRQKKPIDPDAPKKPLPAKLVYLNEEKKRVRDTRAAANEPPLPIAELNEWATSAWDKLSEKERNRYIKDHEKKLEVYNAEMLAYRAKKGLDEPEDVKRKKTE